MDRIQTILAQNARAQRTRWSPRHRSFVQRYGARVSNKGMLEMLREAFPDDRFTYGSVSQYLSRLRRKK